MKRYFWILLLLCYTHFMIFEKKNLADISWKGQNIKIVKKWLIFKLESWSFAWRDIFGFHYHLVTLTLWSLRKTISRYIIEKAKISKIGNFKGTVLIFCVRGDFCTWWRFHHSVWTFLHVLIGLIPHLKAQDNWE